MSESYYGRPIVKPHVWTPYVPLYFWIGGAAGAASTQMLISRLRGNDALATTHKRVALAGAALAPVLLVVDLGVPKRFLNMLRVFKVTSPMSVGSWVLSAFSAAIVASTGAEFLGWKRLSFVLEVLTALIGPPLATYTAVLLADTATPVWLGARRELPFVFVASGIAGAGCTCRMVHAATGRRPRATVHGRRRVGGFCSYQTDGAATGRAFSRAVSCRARRHATTRIDDVCFGRRALRISRGT